jgi:hypothetical protein
MRIVDRVKNILLTPKTEWDVIAGEPTPPAQIVTTYVLPLAAIAAVAYFIGMSVIGMGSFFRMSFTWGLVGAIWHLVGAVLTVFVLAFIIDALAPSFGAQKNFNQAVKVAAYSYTPAWVAGILMILPMLGILVLLASLYGIYLLYLGLQRVMQGPQEKAIGYTVVTVIAAIVVGAILAVIGGLMMTPAMRLGGSGFDGPVSSAPVADPSTTAGKMEQFARKMEEAGKKMEAAEKSGDPQKQMEAALGALGTAMSGGKGVEPLQLDQIKPLLPETFAGLPRTDLRTERGGMAGFVMAKAEGVYGDASGKQVELEVVDTGGVAGIMGLAAWVGVQGERENSERIERTRREGNRVVHEEVSKRGGMNKFALVLNDRFIVSAEGNGVDIGTLKSGVASLQLAKLESLK